MILMVGAESFQVETDLRSPSATRRGSLKYQYARKLWIHVNFYVPRRSKIDDQTAHKGALKVSRRE